MNKLEAEMTIDLERLEALEHFSDMRYDDAIRNALPDLLAYIRDLEREADTLRTALQELVDWQNGPPLISYTEGWTAAMEQAAQALEVHDE